MTGTVVRVDGKTCIVHTDSDNDYKAYIKKKIRGAMADDARPVAVGDVVEFEQRSTGESIITEVFPRKSWLNRRSVSNMNKQQVIVSNVEQLMIVTSVQEPSFHPGIIDRFLVSAAKGHLDAKIVVNKNDLLVNMDRDERDYIENTIQVYESLGYVVIRTSIYNPDSIENLRQHLIGKSTVFAGHSGTGKSSLLTTIAPNLQLRVGAINTKFHKGCHTTTSVRLMPLNESGFVVDTPGIREFSLWQLTIEEVSHYFPEMESLRTMCKFNDCTHTHEPFCAVKEGYKEGKIADFRYNSYFRILESIQHPELDFMEEIEE